MKTIVQGILLAALFAGIFLGLRQVDWISVFKVKEFNRKMEKKLGDLIWQSIEIEKEVLYDDSNSHRIDSLLNILCKPNKIDRQDIKPHIIEDSQPNAFALPDGHLVVHSGLLSFCADDGELAGVLAHELAHMEHGHITQKLSREIGLSLLISASSGPEGQVVVKKALKHLTSTAYDRELETEADMSAVDYMVKAKLDPDDFVSLLKRFSKKEDHSETGKYMSWLSTHPPSSERVEYVREYIRKVKR